MKQGLYVRLAWNNIKKNQSTFLPFGIVSTAVIAVFYMILSIYLQSDGLYYGAEYMSNILYFGAIVVGIVSAVILLYTNRFLMKQRTKEFGLYNILGMEKKHIARVIFWEIALLAMGSMIAGILIGILFSKLVFLIFVNMLGLKAKIPFRISPTALGFTVLVFSATFFVDMFANYIRIALLKPVEMLQETGSGEKEPKAKWLIALVGLITLGIGYYMAITSKNPLDAMNKFFIAVLLVIVGTYCLFIAGSIAFLKLLKKNKKYYYHRTHFVNISGMLFRMKQNAMGLASICILSTMVIVVLSTTVSLYVGIDDEQRTRYPKDVTISIGTKAESSLQEKELLQNSEKAIKAAKQLAVKKGVTITKEECYYEYGIDGLKEGNRLQPLNSADYGNNLVILSFMVAKDYNQIQGTNYQPTKERFIALTNEDTKLTEKTLEVNGRQISFENGGKIKKMQFLTNYCQEICFLVPDFEQIQEVQKLVESNPAFAKNKIRRTINFDLSGSLAAKTAYGKSIKKYIKQEKISDSIMIEDYYSTLRETLSVYASVFFIGIFIGLVFLGATVLIIYYKQVSEGYEDRRNFQIMEKIGLSKKEINHIINSQIRLVFLLPLAVAGMHIFFAFPIIKKIMSMLNLSNEELFVMATLGTCFVFTVVYLLVYKVTSRVYYRLVEKH